MFDIVITKELPGEYELELYDIVVYERDGMLVIHRIVEIEEPNAKHSERHFKLQGDASSRHDVYPVLYSQMKAIYEGDKIPFLGSVVLFIQSPPGWLCFILILFAILITPVVENKLLEEMRKRLAILDAMPVAVEPIAEEPIEQEPIEQEPAPREDLIKILGAMAEKNKENAYIPPVKTSPNVKKSIKFTVSDIHKKRYETKLIISDDDIKFEEINQQAKTPVPVTQNCRVNVFVRKD